LKRTRGKKRVKGEEKDDQSTLVDEGGKKVQNFGVRNSLKGAWVLRLKSPNLLMGGKRGGRRWVGKS